MALTTSPCASCRPSSLLARKFANSFAFSSSFSQKLPNPFPPPQRNKPRLSGRSRTPRQGENMTTTTLVAPISLSNDLLTGAEWSPTHTRELLHLSADIKARPVRYASTLQGNFIALIFEKPSLRTRRTFD